MMHTLVFENEGRRSVSDFVSSVSKTLIQCRHSKLKKFKVSLNYENDIESQVNMWIGYAVSCNVEELALDLGGYVACPNFKVPEHIFTHSYLTDLHLRSCIFQPVSRISWKALRNLAIDGVKLEEDVIQNILYGSPVLESLKFRNCYGFGRLLIGSTSVKKLVLVGYHGPYNGDGIDLEICAPHIVSLDIDGYLILRNLILVDVTSLVEAKLNFGRYFRGEVNSHDRIADWDRVMLKGLLEGLQHVKELVVGNWCLQVISSLELEGWRSPLSKRKYLETASLVRKSYFPGLMNLMHSSPDLETLVVNEYPVFSNSKSSRGDTWRNDLTWQKQTFQCLHLKRVKIVCFDARDREPEFAQFLLQKASALEKMVIYMHLEKRTKSEIRKLRQSTLKLLSCPRASKDSVVLFPGLI